ncbi:hypothetical protein KY284_032227 [Solanum tuberosum]|nr:hypothetical protein KY284_032227 [Solanum tuberosum]
MDAYAAVTSLMGTMHLLSQSSLDLQEGNKEHLESLYDKVGSLLEFLDNSDNELMKDLQKKVKDLANEVEDEVKSQDLLIMEKDEHIRTEANERLLIILQQPIPDIDYVKEELSKQRKNNKLQAGNGSVGGTCSPQSDVSTIDNNAVGYNIEQEVMLHQLTGDSFQMEIISIVGMGGIAWDEIRLWFPENNNTSRILLTTRIMEVARYASYPKNPFPMRPLEPKESWDLFCQKAFGEKDCPTKFRTSGKVIVENCKGLPLILSVVAGTLSSKRTLDEWNQVAQGVSSLVNVDDYQHCSRVLALSYNYLPSHLKACFLYFGVFTKASEISVKKLIRLWIAEGLFELRGRLRDLEEVADSLLHDLIDKSLVMVSKRSLDGKIKTFVPQDHRWVSVHSDRGFISPFGTYNKTRSVHLPYGILEFNILKLGLDHFKLLRVLNLARVKLISFPSELSNSVALRYSITVQLPNGIWKMSQLRHLHCRSIYFLSSPPNKYRVLENLQSVSGLNPSCCTKEIFEGIKKLIELRGCSSSLVTFAMKIQENHEDLGNSILKVDAFDTIRGKIEYFICIGSVKCVGNEDTFERVKYVCPTEEDAEEEEARDRRGSVEPPYSHMAPPLWG